jgi:crotonobetainyl-CoA:carnitine CoA-transferase CaiB-like acyl-CoA transferase
MLRWREFDALVEPYMSTHTAMEIVLTAQAFRLPFAFVPTAEDLLSDEHLAERGFFERVTTPAGEVTVPGAPFKMSETPFHAEPAPAKGSANGDVLAEVGYSKDDMNILSDQGVI